MSYKKIIKELEIVFEKESNNTNALKMEAYMKNHFSFYGIKSPDRKKISAPFLKELASNHKKDYVDISKILWNKKQREFHYVALEFLKRTYKEWDKKSIDLIEYLIITDSWWDTVDFIAAHLTGHYMKTFPSNFKLMEQWNQNKNMWIVRTSILFQLRYKENTDWKLLQKNILNHDTSTEFFIRKAIGWALREYSKTNPKVIIPFVNDNPQLSGLSKREALKWINHQSK